MNMVKATVVAGDQGPVAEFDGQRVQLQQIPSLTNAVGQEVILGIRPEFVAVANQDDPNLINLDVDLVETLGSEALIHASLQGEPFVIRTDTVGQMHVLDGIRGFTIEPHLVKVFDGQVRRGAAGAGAETMTNDPNFSGAAGPTTEELVFDAKEAQRRRKPNTMQRVGDHLKRGMAALRDADPDDPLAGDLSIQADVRAADRLSRTTRSSAVSRTAPGIGLEHFQTLFGNDQFIRALRNTIIISFYGLIFGFPMPILLALMFNEILKQSFKKTAQTIVYLPHFVSSVIIAGIVITAFSPSAGIVNTILGWLGMDPIYFLTKPEWFRPIFVGTGIWQEAGFQSIVYLAGHRGCLSDALRIRGRGRRKPLANDVEDHPAVDPADHHHHAHHPDRQHAGDQLRDDHPALPAGHLRDRRRRQHLHLSPGHPGRPVRPCGGSGPVQRGGGLRPW